MESDSTVLMLRAVVISIILHAAILTLMTRFMPRPAEISVYSSLNVYFLNRTDSPGVAEQTMPSASRESSALAPSPRIPVEPSARKPDPFPEKASDQVLHEVPVPADNDAEIPAEIAPVDSETGLSDPADAMASDQSESRESPGSSENLESAGGSGIAESAALPAGDASQELDVLWAGPSVRILKNPEPSFSLPYGGILPREVKVTFEVKSDGTTASVKIVPPGSGYLNLDQQIRTYVASLLFESFGDAEERRKGQLTLNLRHQESSLP